AAAIVGLARSRPVRIVSAIALAIAIVSPAAVVAAVVWNAPLESSPSHAQSSPSSEPISPLVPPDVAAGTLPATAPNVYANDMSGVVPCPLCKLPPRVYVPNSMAGTVDVIDPTTFQVIDQFSVGQIPHHITPAWDLSELYVENEGSSSLTVIDIHTGRPSRTINIPYPYNLYFTPYGTNAIPAGNGLHGMRVSSDARNLYVSNPLEGSISVIDFASRRMLRNWGVPGGGGPDMLQMIPDGTQLWAEGGYSATVYVFSTES